VVCRRDQCVKLAEEAERLQRLSDEHRLDFLRHEPDQDEEPEWQEEIEIPREGLPSKR